MLHTYLYYTTCYGRNPCVSSLSASSAIQDYFISADSALTDNNNTEEEEDEARQRRGGGGGGGGGRSVKSPRPTSQKSSLAFSIFRLRWRWQEEGTRAEVLRHASRSNSRIDFSQSRDVPLKSTGSSGQHTCVFRFRPALCTLKIRARPRARTDTLHSGAKSIFLGSFLPSRASER